MRAAHKLFSLMTAAALLSATAVVAQNATPAAPTAPARETPRPQDLEPGVDTSSAAQSPDKPSSKPASDAAASSAATPAAGANAAPGTARPAARGKAQDRLELDTTQITGNRELPRVLYIVPWKRSDLGDLVGRPVNSLLDEVLTPVDRDVFQRENRYYRALTPGAAENDALSASDSKPSTPVRSPTPANSSPAAGSQGSATHPANGSGSTNGPAGSGSAAPPPRDEK
jgi:hypothetical protein